MPAGDRLAWYAQQFELVEVNSTFYSVPEPRMVQRWCASTPTNFKFDVKLHQLFSFHSTPAKLLPPDLQRAAQADSKGKVKNASELRDPLLKMFLRSIDVLRREGKLGALLLQLSPAFSPRKHELDELTPLLDQLRDHSTAIEFRNRNWAVGEQQAPTLSFLREHGAIWVNVDAPPSDHFTIMPAELNEITNPAAAYLRLHGRDARAYTTGKTVAARFNYDYSDDEIGEVAERSRRLARDAKEVHVVFNNNALDYAPRAAARLRAALAQIVAPPPRQAQLF